MWLPFVIVALLIAILTLLVYNHYASFTSHPVWVPITVLTGFYLSFCIVFLIPIDVSSVPPCPPPQIASTRSKN